MNFHCIDEKEIIIYILNNSMYFGLFEICLLYVQRNVDKSDMLNFVTICVKSLI